MPDEVDLEELTGLAAALTGDPAATARLVGETLATRGARRASDAAALRAVLVQQYLRRPSAAADAADLRDEVRDVAERLVALSPRNRAALVLVRLSGLTLGETAGLLDETPVALRRRLESAEAAVAADPLAVRATLEALSWRVPEPSAVPAARYRAEQDARRRRGRTRLLAVALGLALLAALAVPTFRMRSPLPTRTAGDWAFGVMLEPPEGWTVELHAVTTDQEYLQVSRNAEECTVVASLPTAPAEERREPPEQTEWVWVDGRRLRFVAAYEGGAGVWWPYGSGGAVSLTCTGEDRRTLVLNMAERLRFSTGVPFSLSVALNLVPERYRVLGAGHQDDGSLIALATGRSLRHLRSGIFIQTSTSPVSTGASLRVGGVDYRLVVEDRDVRLCRAAGTRVVCVYTDAGTESGTQGRAVQRATNLVKEVALALRVAPNLDDRSTWFDAREALPD